MQDSRHLGGALRRLIGWSLIIAPLLIVVQEWVAPEIGGAKTSRDVLTTIATHPGRYQAAAFLGLAAAIVLIPALAGLGGMIGGRGRALARLGGALGVLGAVGFACQNAVTFVYLEMAARGADLEEAVALRERVTGSPGLVTIELLFLGGLLLGLALLAASVWRSRSAPRGAALLILAFIVADVVLSGQGKVFDVLLHALLALGLGRLGWSLLRSRDETRAQQAANRPPTDAALVTSR